LKWEKETTPSKEVVRGAENGLSGGNGKKKEKDTTYLHEEKKKKKKKKSPTAAISQEGARVCLTQREEGGQNYLLREKQTPPKTEGNWQG